jgi:hypothetical protein
MWKTVCQQCKWASGEAYLRSVAETIGKLHEDDNAGHQVVMKETRSFGSAPEEEDGSKSSGPGPSRP